jgi:H+/Cl- antiporter ClcA
LLEMRKFFLHLPKSTRWWHPVVGGVTVGLMGWFVPQVLGVGYGKSGFDAATGLFPEDMFEAGIVDPLRVVRSSLNAAASEACLLLLTEVVLGAIPEEAPKQMTGTIPGRR